MELGDRLVSVNGEEVEGLEWPLVSKMLELTEDDGVANLGFFRDQVAHAACTHPSAPSGAAPRESDELVAVVSGKKTLFCQGAAGTQGDLAATGGRGRTLGAMEYEPAKCWPSWRGVTLIG